jgi:cytochrome c oxidase cbb3-type subunit III
MCALMRLRPTLMTMMLALLVSASPALAVASAENTQTDSPEAVFKARNNPAIRGGIVFRTYCILCHGERGDGMSRGAKLYGSAILDLKTKPREYTEKIIRLGGKPLGLSDWMPSWKDELSEEQIGDVIEYLSLVKDQVSRGAVVFRTNCILCHGVKGNGKGRASVFFDPPPANLTMSDKNDEYKKMIITLGGKAMGRSEVMPIWGEQISEQQIDDVVAYLRTILVTVAQ